jgi:hypothetical protein
VNQLLLTPSGLSPAHDGSDDALSWRRNIGDPFLHKAVRDHCRDHPRRSTESGDEHRRSSWPISRNLRAPGGESQSPGKCDGRGQISSTGTGGRVRPGRSEALLALGLRPSEVVTRDYNRSRAWARRIYDEGGWTGVRWWSYYDSKWSSADLWGISRLTAGKITPLTLSDPALVEASRAIVRPISLRSVGLSAEINKIQVDTTGPVGLQRS